MVLTKENFQNLDLSNLLINIYSYAKDLKDPIIYQYSNLCIECARKLWTDQYHYFENVNEKFLSHNKNYINFGKISSDERNIIYYLISKDE